MNPRTYRPALGALAAIGTAGGVLGIATSGALAHSRPAASIPPTTLNGQLIKARSGTAKPGTVLKSSAIISNRVFSSAHDGFALANDGQAQYPATTTNGGTTWKISGPALHVDAADAPDAVDAVGVAGKVDFVYGPGVVDVTGDGGSSWYKIYPQGNVTAVVKGERGIAAYVQSTGTGAAVSSTAQYVSTNAGRTWTLSTELGG